jgi:FkbM family methyltransferase
MKMLDTEDHVSFIYPERTFLPHMRQVLGTSFEYVTNWKRAIDGGAHYGHYANYMAQFFDEVVAFEARTDIFECAKYNVVNNVNLFNMALGPKYTYVNICTKNLDNSGCGYVNGAGVIPMIQMDLTDVGFIKLDLEGLEYDVLVSVAEDLQKIKPVILVEDKHSAGSVTELLNSLGAERIHITRDNELDKLFVFR